MWSYPFGKEEDQEVNAQRRMLALNLIYLLCSVPEEFEIQEMRISECKSK